jgi:prepilin-type N-terminal cleavage/methylation domain-containing protein
MKPKHPSKDGVNPRCEDAFTLIELLVVIAIIAVLISILLPALHAARSKGEAIKCCSNIRSISQATAMYYDDQQDYKVIPWYMWPPYSGYSPNLICPWVFGGFQSQSLENDGYTADCEVYPAEQRPLNRFVDRGASGKRIIDLYIDPADRSFSTAIIGQSPDSPVEEPRSSWQVNGSSYTLNTRWAQGYNWKDGGNGSFDVYDFEHPLPPPATPPPVDNPYGRRIAPHLTGGEAAEFINWVEQGFYSASYRAGPTIAGIGGGNLGRHHGWHREFSYWSVGFADGHAKYGYFDTRQIFGLGGTIWQPNMRLVQGQP